MRTVVASTMPPKPSRELSQRWSGPDSIGRRAETIAAIRAGEARSHDLRGVRLTHVDLNGCDLTGCDLTGADLSLANLSGASLAGANLSSAILVEANLVEAELAGATLLGAKLDGADASRAGFGQADLRHTSFFGAKLESASFVEARLGRGDFRNARMSGARLTGADLSRAEFGRAELVDAELSEAIVSRATFIEADLRRARLRSLKGFDSACFLCADVRDVDFSGAYLLRRHILDENYLHEFKSRSGFHRAVYWAWWVSSDCGRSLLRWSVWLAIIATCFGFGYQLTSVDFGAHETWLSPFYYSVVTLTSLGYGDVLPVSLGAQAMAMCEVAVGYLLLGGLISIFSNKLARRGE